MRESGEVRGLNTAATLWGSAAVGAACGAHRIGHAVLVTALVLAGNTLLRPLVNAINRAPRDESTTEASYEVRAVVDNGDVMKARDLVIETPNSSPTRSTRPRLRRRSASSKLQTSSAKPHGPRRRRIELAQPRFLPIASYHLLARRKRITADSSRQSIGL